LEKTDQESTIDQLRRKNGIGFDRTSEVITAPLNKHHSKHHKTTQEERNHRTHEKIYRKKCEEKV